MLKIGIFSKLSRISIRMLRHYDEIGLLMPSETDGLTGYRYYTEGQLPTAGWIVALRDMGFGLSAIAELLGGMEDAQALSRILSIKRSELQEEAEAVNRRMLLLETAMNRLRKDGTMMNFNVTLKMMPELYVASVRMSIPTYQEEGMLWQTLMRETAPLHIQDTDPSYALAIFHDGEFKEAEVDVEVQKSVKGRYQDTAHVTFKTTPAVEIASCTYKGSYDKMGEVNAAVAGWVEQNGYEMSGLSFNIYHVSPHEASNPEEFVTEVCYPVKTK